MKVTATIRLLVMMLTVGCGAHVTTCSSIHGNETDMLSLLEFKKSISLDPHQALVSWNDNTHFCNWEGVGCIMRDPRRVDFLNLSSQGLVGQISHSLGNLTFLKYLDLSDNSFAAEIPPSLGHLRRLRYVYLSNNTLQGSIPSFANSSLLKSLLLNGNNLVGQIPADWPPNIQTINLSANNLTGTFPASLANLTMLTDFRCLINKIGGDIPREFAKFHKLQMFNVGANQLTGRFPRAVLNLSTLVYLGLAYNHFSGEVPSNLGTYLPSLHTLLLASNFFQGHIPPSLINASKLLQIDMPGNNLTGVVPGSFGKLTKLSWLNLEFNKLEAHNNQDWEFMDSLANCTQLRVLSIVGNRLEGHLPASLGNLSTQLETLLFGENRLVGSFPSGIANFHHLNYLGLEGNYFSGVIPEWLGSLHKLQKVHLNDNNFTGFIPTSLSNLSLLGYISLGSNKFGGHIPTSLGSLRKLEVLNISNNNLHGTTPVEIFGIPTITKIDLSSNNLDGQLPNGIGNAKQLVYFSLSTNKLSGDIPKSLGYCESLEYIALDSNTFNGSIPTSFANIRSIKFLNLSHNRLTGPIPDSLANLQFIDQLDLSFNNLEGEVPADGIFKNASAMLINGNEGLCGGTLALDLVPCPIVPLGSAKHKHHVVLDVVISGATIVSVGVVIVVLLLWRGKQNRKFAAIPIFGTKFPRISYGDLVRATDGFSSANLIGTGSSSSVYQGKLIQHGEVVAVKVFSADTRGSQKSFMAECNTLRNVRHRNIVPILTACSSVDSRGNDFKALVYEFMPRGDLDKLLHSAQDDGSTSSFNYISLSQRLSIGVDVSDAVAHLHHNHQGSIVHCDLKPSNILLDNDMVAHVGDFGLARLQFHPASSSSGNPPSTCSLGINGTIGYIAPEGGQVSVAADVYSFGIVLLEIFIRKRPTDDMFKDGLSIVKFAEINLPDKILQVIDPELVQELDLCQEAPMPEDHVLHCLLYVLNVGLCCTKSSPSERISMQEVSRRLHRIRDAHFRD